MPRSAYNCYAGAPITDVTVQKTHRQRKQTALQELNIDYHLFRNAGNSVYCTQLRHAAEDPFSNTM